MKKLLIASMFATTAFAQPTMTVPAISIETPAQVGVSVHAHLRILNITPATTKVAVNDAPIPGNTMQTPASIACIYGYTNEVDSCNPNEVTQNVTPKTGAQKVIAVVEAHHYPNALVDLQAFSKQFGLPAPSLSVVFASGKQPTNDPCGWEIEAALDLQWAHAMAPNAKLIIVEAASQTLSDMLVAIKAATKAVQAAGGGVVSMSFGTSEFASEASYDASYFNNTGVIYFASSGDMAGVNWPCASASVVCVGGTTLRTFGNNAAYGTTGTHVLGDFDQEMAWNQTGGGVSKYVAKPAYQASSVTGNFRGVPDVALAADGMVGSWVHYTPSNTTVSQWMVVGGTSWASPMAAGITANSSTVSTTTTQELTKLYANPRYFTDTKNGVCGTFYDMSTAVGWDPCTGLGSYYNYK